MIVPEMAYFPVTFCQGFDAEFSRLNSEEAQINKQFLPLNILCYMYRKCAPPRLALNNHTKSESEFKK